jgi:uncharacterized DUF497 family protein
MLVTGFDWDHGNWPKCGKHGVTQSAIETLFLNNPAIYPDLEHSRIERRFLAIGQDEDNRWMLVAFTLRTIADEKRIRPISARYMHAREIEHYERHAHSQANPDAE